MPISRQKVQRSFSVAVSMQREQVRSPALARAACSHVIQRGILVAQIPDQRLVAQRPARDAFAQHAGPIALSLSMNSVRQPALERSELAAAEVRVEVAEVA